MFEDLKDYSPSMFYAPPAVNIKFKGDPSAGCGFTGTTNAHAQSESTDRTQEPQPLRVAAHKLLSQAFEYVYPQWFECLYRFVWLITLASGHLQIWK